VKRCVLLVAAVLLIAAGCGKAEQAAPTLPRPVVQRLLRALDDPAELQARAIAAVNAGGVPAELQEPLLSHVNALVAEPTPARRAALARWLRALRP
jgi:hypothetical protein